MSTGQLQHEIKKKHPFESPEEEAMLNLMRTNDLFGIVFERQLRKFGLTSSQYNVLRILRGEGVPLPCLEIASRMIQVVPAITGLIDRLEKQQLVERNRCPKDRRVVHVQITAKALDLLKQMDGPILDLDRSLLKHMTQPELVELSRLLAKARQPLLDQGKK